MLDERELVIKQRSKLIALRVEFDVFDADGGELGSVVQAGRDAWDKTLHPRADAATLELAASLGVEPRTAHLLTPFEIRSPAGDVLLRLVHIKALKSSVAVCAPDGREIGRITLENVLGKSRFRFEAVGDNVGSMKAVSWKRKNFAIADGEGTEIARVDMTKGTSGDRTDANDYAVHVHRSLEDPLRSLAVASAIAVDLILWQRHDS